MTHSFRLLGKLSVIFKVLAFLVFTLMMVGLVATVMNRQNLPPTVPLLQVVTNMVFSGILAFLMLFTLGEIIRILLAIESNTHRE